MRKTHAMIVRTALALLTGTVVALVPTAAHAGTAQAEADQILAGLIEANPGAQRVDSTTVKLANGVIAQVSTNTNSRNSLAGGAYRDCGYGWLCMYDTTYYQGSRLKFYNCGFVNIGSAYGWSDRFRSLINNQTTGTWSEFYNWNGSSWEYLASSKAFDANPSVWSGLWQTDAVRVC